MTTIQMRQQVTAAYPSQTWKKKIAHASDGMVVAIYYRMLQKNMFEPKKEKSAQTKHIDELVAEKQKQETIYQQLSLFD